MTETGGEASRYSIARVYLPSSSPPPTLDLETNSSENWKLWKQIWYNYLIVSGLDSKPECYVTALLIHIIGVFIAANNWKKKTEIILIKPQRSLMNMFLENESMFNRCYQNSVSLMFRRYNLLDT